MQYVVTYHIETEDDKIDPAVWSLEAKDELGVVIKDIHIEKVETKENHV